MASKEFIDVMVEKYNLFFGLYLQACKSAYDPEHPYDNLKECIRLCENLGEQLVGMVSLIYAMEGFTMEATDKEYEKINKEFSSIKICNARYGEREVLVHI